MHVNFSRTAFESLLIKLLAAIAIAFLRYFRIGGFRCE
jgi:hypothetical protein